jgi:hypothetical protein
VQTPPRRYAPRGQTHRLVSRRHWVMEFGSNSGRHTATGAVGQIKAKRRSMKWRDVRASTPLGTLSGCPCLRSSCTPSRVRGVPWLFGRCTYARYHPRPVRGRPCFCSSLEPTHAVCPAHGGVRRHRQHGFFATIHHAFTRSADRVNGVDSEQRVRTRSLLAINRAQSTLSTLDAIQQALTLALTACV